jgi:hypothetical protein
MSIKSTQEAKIFGQMTPSAESRQKDRQEEEEVREKDTHTDYINRGHYSRKREQEGGGEGGVIHDVCP